MFKLLFTTILFMVTCRYASANYLKCAAVLESEIIHKCEGGQWPFQFAFDRIPETVRDLTVEDSGIWVSAEFRELPVTTLTSLTFRNIYSWDTGSNPNPRFPFIRVLKRLDKPKLETLVLDDVKMTALTGQDFNEFTGLKVLTLQNCQLGTIHPDSFAQQTLLRELRIISDTTLASLSWDVLKAAANSLEIIYLTDNREMKQIIFSGAAMTLNRLTRLDISGPASSYFYKPKLPTLSQAIVDTFGSTAIGSTTSALITFMYNDNYCGSCELLSLVKWARETASPNRELQATCVKENGDFQEFKGTAAYWQDHPIEDCRVIVRTTTAAPTENTKKPGVPVGSTTTPPGSGGRRIAIETTISVFFSMWLIAVTTCWLN